MVTHSVEEAVFISDVVFTLSRRPSRIIERLDIGCEKIWRLRAR